MNSNVTFKERYDELINAIEMRLKESIKSNTDEPVMAICKRVAADLHRDSRYISEIFSFISGIPLGSYLKLRKLEIAFNAKIKGNKSTWENAALMVYRDVTSFKNAFKHTYGLTVTEAEKDPGRINLTYPLYLDLVLEGRYANMENKLVFDNNDWEEVKEFELYEHLYGIGFTQLSFARDYVKDNPQANLEFILEILAEQYSSPLDDVLGNIDRKAFDLVVKTGLTRWEAECIVGILDEQGYSDIDAIDPIYFKIMEQVLDNQAFGKYCSTSTQKDVTYNDYKKVKAIMGEKGYHNYWDLFRVFTDAEDNETWEEAIERFMKENPSPIVGNWTEEDYEEYDAATRICYTEPLAKILLFAEKVYGKDRLAGLRCPHDILVFAAMMKRKMTENEAIAFIEAEINEELSAFLNEDLWLKFEYNQMVEEKSKC